MGTEPATIIGLIASIVVIVAQQVLQSGIVSSAGAVQWLNLLISVVPLIAGLLIRSQVVPASTVEPVDPPTTPAPAA